jgi:hypothetical protein
MAEMRPSRVPLPAPLHSAPVTAFRRYYERSDSCAGGSSARIAHEHRPDPAQVSLRPVPCRDDHSVSNHPTCPGVALTRYPLATPVPRICCGPRFRHSRRWLITHVRPNRVRYPTDWSFPVDCSPPRLAATQLSLGTGRRAYARRGLSPLCHGTIAGARRMRSANAMMPRTSSSSTASVWRSICASVSCSRSLSR